jgi:hypothetical protein
LKSTTKNSTMRNHGLITGWRILGTLSNRLETIAGLTGLGRSFVPSQAGPRTN